MPRPNGWTAELPAPRRVAAAGRLRSPNDDWRSGVALPSPPTHPPHNTQAAETAALRPRRRTHSVRKRRPPPPAAPSRPLIPVFELLCIALRHVALEKPALRCPRRSCQCEAFVHRLVQPPCAQAQPPRGALAVLASSSLPCRCRRTPPRRAARRRLSPPRRRWGRLQRALERRGEREQSQTTSTTRADNSLHRPRSAERVYGMPTAA